MGKYSGAGAVKVKKQDPLLNEVAGNHLVKVLGFRDGKKGGVGKRYFAMEVEVLASEPKNPDDAPYKEGEKRVALVTEKGGEFGEHYFFADVKGLVGPAQGIEDVNEVDEDEIEAAVGEDQKGQDAVLDAKVFSKTIKPKNKDAYEINETVFTFVASSEAELG